MKFETNTIRSGYDRKKCLVHARCCFAPDIAVATAQYLNVAGSDLFDGLLMSISHDKGKSWSEFSVQEGLRPVVEDGVTTVGCDATPMFHKKTEKILLLGQTASYGEGDMHPVSGRRQSFYSVYDKEKNTFSKMKFIKMPTGYEVCGNGSGQSVELANGDLLIPVYYCVPGKRNMYSAVMRCTFDGTDVEFREIGNSLTVEIERGAYEPSLAYHHGVYYMTLRSDECGLVAKSEDGLHYTDMHLWTWDDGELLQNYNTQQHWMTVGENLYLVYTRRGAGNDHVFRHRAPLFTAKVENMHLVRGTEVALTPERGARCGNFGVTAYGEGKAAVMVAEWMQPAGCEKYGSDNTIFLTIAEE
ncbi:MAG: exo-alpha-sialidase [Clostridia bacterium]|nr:exo-alpha-sialidase [Clostridia bacterium]